MESSDAIKGSPLSSKDEDAKDDDSKDIHNLDQGSRPTEDILNSEISANPSTPVLLPKAAYEQFKNNAEVMVEDAGVEEHCNDHTEIVEEPNSGDDGEKSAKQSAIPSNDDVINEDVKSSVNAEGSKGSSTDSDSVVFDEALSSNDDNDTERDKSIQGTPLEHESYAADAKPLKEDKVDAPEKSKDNSVESNGTDGASVKTPIESWDEKPEALAFINWCQQSLTLSERDFVLRREAVDQLQENLNKTNPEIHVELYGSSYIRSAVKGSDVNVFLFSQEKVKHEVLLATMHDSLSKNDLYDNLEVHYDSKCISLSVHDKVKDLTMYVTERKSMHLKSNTVVKRYFELDARALILQQAIRTWAAFCGLDNQQKGSLPAVSYYIMVIHFLQQQKPPVLPCIHEMVIKTERSAHNFSNEEMDEIMKLEWKSENTEPVDILLSKFFKFYINAKICKSKYTITLKQLRPLTLGGKKWPQNSISIEDPLSKDTNLGISMKSKEVLKYFENCLRHTHCYLNAVDEDKNKDLHRLSRLNDKKKKKFYTFKFSDQKQPVLHCFNCNRVGHWLKTCPLMAPIECRYDPPGKAYMDLLNDVLDKLVQDYCINKDDKKTRENVLHKLEIIVRERFKRANLSLFGSSVNGFGFHTSDLDICMMSHGPQEPEDLDKQEIIKTLAKMMRSNPSFAYNVTPIPSAKVPILRFHLVKNRQEVDISLYNCLALRNSQLLQAYSSIDPRVRTLGFTLKLFAKFAAIKDASQGSLSSYAYILMLIYFLQHTSPPILPCLQELYVGDNQPEDIVEECNTWFYNDIEKLNCEISSCESNLPSSYLRETWPKDQTNRQTAAELWLEFLHFYAAKFNWKEDVVCIRKTSRLTKLEKSWLSYPFAIEDPFELCHNLGNVVKQNMAGYILQLLPKTLHHFAKERDGRMFPNIMERQEHFFDFTSFVEKSEAPQQRCFECHRVGHFASECNMKRDKEKRRERKLNGRRENKSEGDQRTPVKNDRDNNRHTQSSKKNERPRAQSNPSQKVIATPPRNPEKTSNSFPPRNDHNQQTHNHHQSRPPLSPESEVQTAMQHILPANDHVIRNSNMGFPQRLNYPVVPNGPPYNANHMPSTSGVDAKMMHQMGGNHHSQHSDFNQPMKQHPGPQVPHSGLSNSFGSNGPLDNVNIPLNARAEANMLHRNQANQQGPPSDHMGRHPQQSAAFRPPVGMYQQAFDPRNVQPNMHHEANAVHQMGVRHNSPPRQMQQNQQGQFNNHIPFPQPANPGHHQPSFNQPMNASQRPTSHMQQEIPRGQELLDQWMQYIHAGGNTQPNHGQIPRNQR